MNPEEIYSTKEVCEQLKISRECLYGLIKAGKLKAFNIGIGQKRKRYKITASSLTEFINRP